MPASTISTSELTGSIQYQICQYCQQHVPARMMKQHLSTVHGSEMPFSCPLCGKGYMSNTGLQLHKATHQERKFSCPICVQKFKQKAHLKNHLDRIHKLAQCPTCSTLLPLGMEFNQHLLICQWCKMFVQFLYCTFIFPQQFFIWYIIEK